MSEITLVTSFFDIGRENNSIKDMARGTDTYVDYFRTWARMKNKLVIYTEKGMADKLYEVRKGFGLEEKTEIIVLDDIYSIMPEMYQKMCKIEQDKNFLEFRYYSKAMSNQAKYCYLVLLQYWFIQDAVTRNLVSDYVAWIDLGFNHGLNYYSKPEEFDYEWKYPFDDKINCFTLFNPNDICSIDSLQFQKDCFMGGMMIMPKQKATLLWKYIREAEEALFMLDCMDDDQQLLLMAYKVHPEDFTIRICNWFEPLKICGGDHLSVVNKQVVEKKKNFVEQTKNILYNLLKRKHQDFCKKSKNRADRVYNKKP